MSQKYDKLKSLLKELFQLDQPDHSMLMVDTRYIGSAFTAQLLEAISDVDGKTDGTLFHSENLQALSLMESKNALEKIVAHYARSRLDDEHFGDFAIRAGCVPEVTEGRRFND